MPSDTRNSNRAEHDPRPSSSVKIEWKVSRRFADDIIVTAFDPGYGGALYWAAVVEYRPRGRWATADDNTREVVITDRTNPYIQFVVTYETIVRGLQKATEKGYMNITKALVEDDGGEIDADLADVVAQLGVLGEVVYG